MNQSRNPAAGTRRTFVGVALACLAASLAMTCFFAAVGCGGPATPGSDQPLKVLSSSPSGASYFPSEPIRIHFDHPIADADGLGEPLTGELPATIEPAVAMTARFTDRQTLVLVPEQPLAASTRYQVRLRGELAARTGDYSFEFVSVPLEIEGVWGIELDTLPARPELPLHFNQPVEPAAIAKHCRFEGTGDPISVITKTEQTGAVISLAPAAELELGTGYRLVCSELAGAGGSEPMIGLFSLDLETHPKLEIVAVTPTADEPIPAERTQLTIRFSTPMDRSSLRGKIKIEPAVEGIDRGWVDYRGLEYRTSVELQPKVSYRLTIGAETTDKLGQKLGADHVHEFKTGNVRPTISMETGIYALETVKTGYPIWTRNIGELQVACARVPEASVVKLLTSGMDYDPWYNAQQSALKWAELGLIKKRKIFRPTAAENEWHLSRLALGETCGGTTKRGLYLADVKSPDIVPDPKRHWAYRSSRRVLANVTDLGVLIKAGTSAGVIWVTAISTGKPVAGATVAVYSPRGKRVFRGTTDRSGLVKLPGTAKLLAQPGVRDDDDEGVDFESYRSQRMIAVVEKRGDIAVVDGNWANGIQTWNFGVDEDRKGGLARIRGFIQSDRGIYRPGETVKLKGLLREFRGSRSPRVPRERKLAVTVTNSRGSNVYDKRLDVSRFGGFSFDYAVAEEAPTGDYLVTAKINEQTFRERFTVEEFRKVTFEIGVKGVERHQRLGQKLDFAIDANYLFGAPVAGAKVEWSVGRRDHLVRFAEFPSYGFADYAAKGYFGWWWYDRNSHTDFVADGDGATNARGQFSFAVSETDGELDSPQDYLTEVTVTDDTDQSVTKRVAVTAHPTDFYLGLHAQEWVQAVGMPFSINAVAVTPEGAQVGHKAVLSFIRERRVCKWVKRGYRSYPECEAKHVVAMTRTIEIPATGVATERIYPKKPGEYIVRLEAKDGRGKKVSSSTYVWVLGKGEAFWSGDESARMSLIASKTEYEPGETAKLVPRTGLVKPTALVTLERNGVIEAFVREMDSPSEGIEVPLTGSFAPNVFATVAMVSGRHGPGDRKRPRFKLGVVDLKVSSESKRLTLEVITDKDKYEPGERVRGVVKVRSGNRPVVAEVSVSAADEGVLQLIGYQTPDPMKSFYKSWGLGVDNSTNWNRIARLNAPDGADPDEGGDAGSSKSGIRSKFVNSAFWAPALVTNGRGEARFEFDAPDNLTAFRLMAVAADIGDRFGSADSRITIAKPLLAKPVLPRFLTEGDKAEVGIMVHNYTGVAGTAVVTSTGIGVELTPKTQRVRLAAGSAERVRFYAVTRPVQRAGFEFDVRMGEFRDGLRVELPVQRPLVMDEKILARGTIGVGAGAGGAAGQATIPIAWTPGADSLASSVSVTVDRLGMSELEPGLRSLIEYPYGCLEQTLSRFIPLTKVADLAASLGMKTLQGPALDRFLRAGAAKVVRHQHADGNYSLWPGGDTYPHLTVYATYGLEQARVAGVKIDESAYARGLGAIKKWVGTTLVKEMNLGTAAMAAFLLADSGKPDHGLIARLYEKRSALPFFGRGFLLMAMHHAGTDAGLRRTLTGELAAAAAKGSVTERFDQSAIMGSDTRSSAIVLSALVLEDPENAVVDVLASGLKSRQGPSGAWGTTQENLFSLVALADYARSKAGGSSSVELYLDGKRVATKRLGGETVLSLTRTKAETGTAELVIKSSGRAVYTVRARQGLPLDVAKPDSAGFTVERELLDPKTGKPVTQLRVGQILVAKVRVNSPIARKWVALVDPLPAGLEPVNTRLATSRRGRRSSAENTDWRRSHWDHIELRDSEVLAFRDRLPQGETVLTYRVRVSMPGKYTALPAHVEAMYEPAIKGRSAARKLEVTR